MARPAPFTLRGRRRPGLADAALAGTVIAVVALMIVPLPTWLLDLLLAGNLAVSVAILLITLYVSDALRVAAFPTLLLITTLVRLALNVSSTRLILLQADAGRVIQSFGDFVVRGNYVVGGVIFLILAIIQFVVIAKGSERVAEVGARFTLDAMPGKQMAIDGELRSGTIDGATATRRRRALARESQFYGAMDGAMKFVKGDTIASFLITAINLLGGLAIGIGQRGMEAEAALRSYGLLTIGDGLVSQIPTLVIATAAGVLVTRVASEEPDTPLGLELASQIFGAPEALRIASLFVVGLALVPGLPALPFLIIGALMFAASRARARSLRSARAARAAEPYRRDAEPGEASRFVPVVVPWTLEVSADLAGLLEDSSSEDSPLSIATERAREQLFRELGAPLPGCRLAVDPELAERHAVLSIHEVPARAIAVPEGSASEAARSILSEATETLRARAADFVGIAETRELLDELERIAPATVHEVVPEVVTPTVLTEVLRRLLEEGVAVRNLEAILEALARADRAEKDPLNLAEHVRTQLRRPLTHSLTGGSSELGVFLLDPQIEATVRSAITRTSTGSFLTLAPAASRDIIRALQRCVDGAESAPIVVLTQPDIRRFVRKLIESDLPGAVVTSYSELLPEIHVKTLGRATLAGA